MLQITTSYWLLFDEEIRMSNRELPFDFGWHEAPFLVLFANVIIAVLKLFNSCVVSVPTNELIKISVFYCCG